MLQLNMAYTPYNIQDYPSIGQIAEKLFEFDVIPIFAVVDNIQNIYSVCIQHNLMHFMMYCVYH